MKLVKIMGNRHHHRARNQMTEAMQILITETAQPAAEKPDSASAQFCTHDRFMTKGRCRHAWHTYSS